MPLIATRLRSLWLVPVDAHHPDALPPAPVADAVILDLAGVEAPGALAGFFATARVAARHGVLVRLSPLGAGRTEAELAACGAERPDAVLLPGCAGRAEVQACGAKLAVWEATQGWEAGVVGIAAAPGALGFLSLAGFAGASPRLLALVLEPRTLDSGGMGEAGGALLRTLLLLGAQAAGVPAWDATTDARGLGDQEARHRGFSGRITREGALLGAIEADFSPDG